MGMFYAFHKIKNLFKGPAMEWKTCILSTLRKNVIFTLLKQGKKFLDKMELFAFMKSLKDEYEKYLYCCRDIK